MPEAVFLDLDDTLVTGPATATESTDDAELSPDEAAAAGERVARVYEPPTPEEYEPRSGARAALEGLSDRGFAIGLVTNGAEEPQRAKLRATGLDGLFDATFFATPERGIKPDPRPFTTTLDALGVAPTAAVSVGDGYETDIRPAIELGMDTVWVTSRPDPDRETDYAVARPAELLQLPPLA